MARLRALKDAAFPRGRPRVIPFPAKREGDAPKPVLEYHSYFVVGGVPVHFIGARWKAEDAAYSPTPTSPDPHQPGIVLAARFEDADGQIIQAVSYEVFLACCRSALPAGCKALAAGTGVQVARR